MGPVKSGEDPLDPTVSLFLSLDFRGNVDRGIKWLPSLLTAFIRAIKNSHHPLLADPRWCEDGFNTDLEGIREGPVGERPGL